jgi:hypothetical protein
MAAIKISNKQNLFKILANQYLITEITAVRRNSIFINAIELPVGKTYREIVEKLIRKEL